MPGGGLKQWCGGRQWMGSWFPQPTGIHSSHTTAIPASAVRPRPLISVKQPLLQLLFPAGILVGKYQANQHNGAPQGLVGTGETPFRACARVPLARP